MIRSILRAKGSRNFNGFPLTADKQYTIVHGKHGDGFRSMRPSATNQNHEKPLKYNSAVRREGEIDENA